jgi:two-component system, sensor histidine kinase
MTATKAAASEPHDLSLDMTSALINGLLIYLASGLFVTALPWWQPFTWASIYNVALWGRRFVMRSIASKPMPLRVRWGRYTHWACAVCAGSAVYWLFVPGNLLMQVAVVICLLCIITSMVLESVGDFWRIAVSLCLVIVPTATRMLFEPHPFSVVLGAGGFAAGATWWLLWRRQQSIWQAQFVMRQRAEIAAEALAETTLARARFFAAANHDLRQPVHALGIYLGMLETGKGTPQQSHAVEGMRRSWNALSDLLTQLLDISRAEAGALQPQLRAMHLAEVLSEQIDLHTPTANAQGHRLVTLGGQGLYVWADPLMLARILSNLIDNAIKFSPRGATIALAARRGGGDNCRIQVRDGGAGIPEADQERVFDDFVQIGNPQRDRSAGFGLGLAIARRFTHAMGGQLTLWSRSGAGCVMQVRLPMCAPPRQAALLDKEAPVLASPSLAPQDWGTHRIERLLILEDDPLVAQAMHALAQAWGLECRVLHDGHELLELAKTGDFALCDYRLPAGPTGLEVAAALQGRGIHAALITGEADRHLRNRAEEQRIPLLVKPVTAPQLLALLRNPTLKRPSTTTDP